jgi:DNA mismatch repair ATPase MutS
VHVCKCTLAYMIEGVEGWRGGGCSAHPFFLHTTPTPTPTLYTIHHIYHTSHTTRHTIQAAAGALGELDALSSLASLARTPGYCRPVVTPPQAQGPHLHIQGGRHPMLDAALSAGQHPLVLAEGGGGGGGGVAAAAAVPNDVCLSSDGVRAAIITGPNMCV